MKEIKPPQGWTAEPSEEIKPPQGWTAEPSEEVKPPQGWTAEPLECASRPSYAAANASASLDVSVGASRPLEPIRRVGSINIVRPSIRALELQEQEEQESRNSQGGPSTQQIITLSSDTDSDDSDL